MQSKVEPTVPSLPIDYDIQCSRCPIMDPPKCTCWEELGVGLSTTCSQGNDSEHRVTPMWLHPAHWAPGLFTGAPTDDHNKARVCAKTGRVIHVLSGDHYIDLVILDDHPTDKTKTPIYVQQGYCFKCRSIEWFRFCSTQPATPIIWFTCRN
jgi:hypothetical protein